MHDVDVGIRFGIECPRNIGRGDDAKPHVEELATVGHGVTRHGELERVARQIAGDQVAREEALGLHVAGRAVALAMRVPLELDVEPIAANLGIGLDVHASAHRLTRRVGPPPLELQSDLELAHDASSRQR